MVQATSWPSSPTLAKFAVPAQYLWSRLSGCHFSHYKLFRLVHAIESCSITSNVRRLSYNFHRISTTDTVELIAQVVLDQIFISISVILTNFLYKSTGFVSTSLTTIKIKVHLWIPCFFGRKRTFSFQPLLLCKTYKSVHVYIGLSFFL